MNTKNKKSAETFPVLLQRAMKEKGIPNFIQVARDLKITNVAVSRWMTGDNLPSARLVVRLAEYLGVPLVEIQRAKQLSWLVHKAPLFVHELRRYYKRRAELVADTEPIMTHVEDVNLPLLEPRNLPTRHQKFKIDPDISCGMMGPIWAVCDRLKRVNNGDLAVVRLSQRTIRFDRYNNRLYKGMTAYRVTAILPKE